MSKRMSPWRWTVRTLRLLVFVSALVVGGSTLAQNVPPAQLPKMTFTKNTVFHLPVQMEERTRANLREVCLYVKCGAGDWVRQETGLPTITHFSYKVPRDGEYWFSLVTIDKAGKMTPPDVSQDPPGLRVMVDTQPPVIDVQPWTTPEGDFCIRCQVQDANPDTQGLRASYRDQAGEHNLDYLPGNPNVFKITGELLKQPLRLTATDLCGNVTSREINVREMALSAQQMHPNAAKVIQTAGTFEPPPPVPNPTMDMARTEVQRPTYPPLSDKGSYGAMPVSPPLPNQGPNDPLLPPPLPQSSLPAIPPTPGFAKETIATRPAFPGGGGPIAKQFLNTTHATVDYRIDQVGPSGVGKVEVYLTGDGGQNWQRFQEDQDRRSPVELDLPGEGLFGIRLAITNGNGFGGTPPARGDAPECWIEVDTTVPFVQLRPIEPIQNGSIELRWTASDKNLGPEPVALLFRTRPDAPWQPIARVKNDGLHRWNFPRDQGSQFFVRVEVTDLAGNTAHAETPTAIMLDMTEPHASVVGITGVSPRTISPVGN